MCPAVLWILKDVQVLNDFLPLSSRLRQKLSEEHVKAFNNWNLPKKKQKQKNETRRPEDTGTGESTLSV